MSLTKDFSLFPALSKIRKMEQSAREHFETVFSEHEKIRVQLEATRKELIKRETDLEKREADYNDRTSLKEKTADVMLKLAEERKIENQKLQSRILELEKDSDAKAILEIENQKLQIQSRISELEKDFNAKAILELEVERLKAVLQSLEDKEEELESLQSLNQTLTYDAEKCKKELHEVRKELINALTDQPSRTVIGIKRLGELNSDPFRAAAKRKYPLEEAEFKASKLCSLWEENLKDSNWYPFKSITDKGGRKEIIDDQDVKLKALLNEYGDEVYQAVVTALKEMDDCNGSGRYVVPELWNFKVNRKAGCCVYCQTMEIC